MTPEQLRLTFHDNATSSPAVASLRAYLTTGVAAEDAFFKWRADPMTQMVTRALEELADNPPIDKGIDVAQQYGFTSGLQLAIKLMTQPKRVFPEVFQDPRQPAGELDRAYTVNADSAIDGMRDTP